MEGGGKNKVCMLREDGLMAGERVLKRSFTLWHKLSTMSRTNIQVCSLCLWVVKELKIWKSYQIKNTNQWQLLEFAKLFHCGWLMRSCKCSFMQLCVSVCFPWVCKVAYSKFMACQFLAKNFHHLPPRGLDPITKATWQQWPEYISPVRERERE